MDSTFLCPYCSAKYGVLPSLVGRKVRCHKCENIFSLQYDGTVEKILKRSEKEAKKAPADKKVERPQAKAIKDQTRRVEKLRKSLKAASDEAASDIATSDALEPQADSVTGKSASRSQKAQSDPLKTTIAPKSTRLGLPRFIKWAAAGVLLLIMLLFSSLSWNEDSAHAALDAFTAPMDVAMSKHPQRLIAYRNRMWLHSRDGEFKPDIVLNIDESELGQGESFEWIDVVTITAPLLENMHINRDFAMWHEKGQEDKVESLWAAYEDKAVIVGFYGVLEKEGIRFVRFDKLPKILSQAGLERQLVYVVSVLLGSTLENDKKNRTFGMDGGSDAPTGIIITEFHGADGLALADMGEHYDVSSVAAYCGLVVGFENLDSQRVESRVFDIRYSAGMEVYYEHDENPLVLLSERIYDDVRRKAIRRRAAGPRE